MDLSQLSLNVSHLSYLALQLANATWAAKAKPISREKLSGVPSQRRSSKALWLDPEFRNVCSVTKETERDLFRPKVVSLSIQLTLPPSNEPVWDKSGLTAWTAL